jgi:uncharacterized membrane protein
MFTVASTIEIARPVEDVFAFAGDYRNDPRWRKGVVSMQHEPPGPPALGTVTTETMKFMGRPSCTVGEVTEYLDCRRTAFRSLQGPVECHGFRLFAPSRGGTQFTYSLTLKPRGPLRLFEFLLKSIFQRQVQADLRRLQKLLESDHT